MDGCIRFILRRMTGWIIYSYLLFHHYLQDESSSSSDGTMVNNRIDGDEGRWREKFEFTLSLIREPRYLLSETLVAEQLKLTLKQQAFQLEKTLLKRTIQQYQQQELERTASVSNTRRW